MLYTYLRLDELKTGPVEGSITLDSVQPAGIPEEEEEGASWGGERMTLHS